MHGGSQEGKHDQTPGVTGEAPAWCLSRTARPCHTPCAAATAEELRDLGTAPNGELRVPTSSSTAQIRI